MKRCFFFLLLFASFRLQAQQAPDSLPSVQLIARALPNSIMLRWAPTTPMAWQLANHHGYHLERFTILRDGKTLPTPERVLLSQQPIKPLPLDQWEALARSNDWGGVAAQAIWGETFKMSSLDGAGPVQMYQKVQEGELRFSFALFAADMSRAVAGASGLYWVDNSVRKNETYLYRISSLVPRKLYAINPGEVLVGVADHKPLPHPVDFKAEFGDRQVVLEWNQEALSSFYNAWWVERSDNEGKSFSRISEQPLVFTAPEGRPAPRMMYRLDSLPDNGREYQYRLIGVTPFGELSPASEVVKGSGAARIRYAPHIIEKGSPDNQRVELRWAYEHADSANLAFYSLERSASAHGNYERLQTNIAWDAPRYTDHKPALTNYYRVVAHDLAGNHMPSPPVLVQLIDSIPPVMPRALTGRIDTTGVVHLQWAPNPDTDIYGYRVYRANNDQEEYSQLTSAPIGTTSFTDTLSLKTLSKKVYYKIMAIDLRQNHSELSEALELRRPNKVPPVPPVFKNARSGEEGVALEWISSSSDEVVRHLLYRAPEGSDNWQLLAAFDRSGATQTYIDTKLPLKQAHRYTVVAVGANGLESTPARPVSGQKIDTGLRPAIEKLTAKANRQEGHIQLQWEYKVAGVQKYIIYRAEGDDQLTMLTTVAAGSKTTYTDKAVKPSRSYQYLVQAVFEDGAMSRRGERITLTY
jgi:uncharacterized protein